MIRHLPTKGVNDNGVSSRRKGIELLSSRNELETLKGHSSSAEK